MSDYSYNDMLKMQSEAKKRVLEMQKRSKDVVQNFSCNRKEQNKQECSVREEELPRVPKAISFPADLHANSQAIKNNKSKPVQGRGFDIRGALESVFGNLSRDDYEKMFILSLCLLLAKENNDDSLIFSLMYLLT